jgi:hypothetical protein
VWGGGGQQGGAATQGGEAELAGARAEDQVAAAEAAAPAAAPAAAAAPAKVCTFCGAADAPKYKLCARCKAVRYCSKVRHGWGCVRLVGGPAPLSLAHARELTSC